MNLIKDQPNIDRQPNDPTHGKAEEIITHLLEQYTEQETASILSTSVLILRKLLREWAEQEKNRHADRMGTIEETNMKLEIVRENP
jgi:hypothetical protein